MDKNETLSLFGRYIDKLMENSSGASPAWNIEMQSSGQKNKWNYVDGCMMTALLAYYRVTGDKKYFDFVKGFVDYFVQPDGSIYTYNESEYNLDHIKSGSNLYELYELTGEEKYRIAIENIYNQLKNQPRTAEGSFWHKKIYPNQIWLDGLYMAQPFYAKYEYTYNQLKNCSDIFKQFQNVNTLLREKKDGLYYHGYDSSRVMSWADKETGCSACSWLRAQGWFVMALVDTLEIFDERLYYEYRTLQDYLKELIDALLPWQDVGGMFYQIPNMPELEGNYLETSGTAILSYAILKAVRLGFLPSKYLAFGEKAFYGICEKYLEATDDTITLGGICLVAGLGGKENRDGSPAYYFSEPIVKNESKGVAPMLLAYTEICQINK